MSNADSWSIVDRDRRNKERLLGEGRVHAMSTYKIGIVTLRLSTTYIRRNLLISGDNAYLYSIAVRIGIFLVDGLDSHLYLMV